MTLTDCVYRQVDFDHEHLQVFGFPVVTENYENTIYLWENLPELGDILVPVLCFGLTQYSSGHCPS